MSTREDLGVKLISDTASPTSAGTTQIAELPTLFARILVATDGSKQGDRAVAFGAALALRHGSEIELCCAVDQAAAFGECSSTGVGSELVIPLIAEMDTTAETILAKASAHARHLGVRPATVVLEGYPPDAIVARQKARTCDAIVIGTSSKRGFERVALGSTADGVLHRSTVPVFVVPMGACDVAAAFERILVGVDDSDPSDAAVTYAIQIARAERSKVAFCGIAETQYLASEGAAIVFDRAPILAEARASVRDLVDAAAARAGRSDIACERLVADGDPMVALPTIAATQKASLIVIGTHGRRGLRRWLLGSVAEAVVQHSRIPVAVVRSLVHQS
jgi:nucleotide-binding universal stress UspA family protein